MVSHGPIPKATLLPLLQAPAQLKAVTLGVNVLWEHIHYLKTPNKTHGKMENETIGDYAKLPFVQRRHIKRLQRQRVQTLLRNAVRRATSVVVGAVGRARLRQDQRHIGCNDGDLLCCGH